MNRDEVIKKLKGDLSHTVQQAFDSDNGILSINLSTTDGFNLRSLASDQVSAEATKLAAMSSTIFSLSKASSDIFEGFDLEITTIETSGGHLLFLRTNVLTLDCVLLVATNHSMSLAEARFVSKRLASAIAALENDVEPV